MKKKFEKSKEFKMTARASHDVIVPVFTIYIKKKKIRNNNNNTEETTMNNNNFSGPPNLSRRLKTNERKNNVCTHTTTVARNVGHSAVVTDDKWTRVYASIWRV